MEEIERVTSTLVQMAGSSEFCIQDERWRLAETRMMKIAARVGPKAVMGFLLGVLRRADVAEEVVDVVAKTMALCSGPCAAPPQLRTFIFSPTLIIHINEMDYIEGGLGWKVWGAALILSWRLLALKDVVRGKNVLELGSGCGLCGLLLANLGAAKVVLTDNVSDILVNLSKNISRLTTNGHSELKPYRQVNHEKFLSNQEQNMVGLEHPQDKYFADYLYEKSTAEEDICSCLINVRKLDWMEDSTMASHNTFIEIQAPDKFPRVAVEEKFDWIVGSDLLYEQKCSLALAGVPYLSDLSPGQMYTTGTDMGRTPTIISHFIPSTSHPIVSPSYHVPSTSHRPAFRSYYDLSASHAIASPSHTPEQRSMDAIERQRKIDTDRAFAELQVSLEPKRSTR